MPTDYSDNAELAYNLWYNRTINFYVNKEINLMGANKESIYESLGGDTILRQLLGIFYRKVQDHPKLGSLFPDNIQPVMEKQRMFLTQFLGGPSLYSDVYGHPMMRARHMPFEITPERAEAWLDCMRLALIETGVDKVLQEVVLERLQAPAHHFINSEDKL
jgi:hemoglobin